MKKWQCPFPSIAKTAPFFSFTARSTWPIYLVLGTCLRSAVWSQTCCRSRRSLCSWTVCTPGPRCRSSIWSQRTRTNQYEVAACKCCKLKKNTRTCYQSDFTHFTLVDRVLIYCWDEVHFKQYRFFINNLPLLLPCNPRRTLAGFSWGCMVIVMEGSF